MRVRVRVLLLMFTELAAGHVAPKSPANAGTLL